MRNQRNNFIPVPTKPAKSAPKPLSRLSHRISSSSQTERVVLIKEENLFFSSCTRLGQNDGGMRRDYVKAVNYINSCHKFVNTIIEKNNAGNRNVFLLPMVTNFIPIFSHLTAKKKVKKEKVEVVKPISQGRSGQKSEERKSKSSFGVKRLPKEEEEAVIDPITVGDCGTNVTELQESKVADIVREQLQHFLSTLHEDMSKAKKYHSETPKTCKNLDIVKQRLEELSKICFLQKKIETTPTVVQMAVTPPPPSSHLPDYSGDYSNIPSDTDEEKIPEPELKVTCYEESSPSSESDSDIKSDSDIEIK